MAEQLEPGKAEIDDVPDWIRLAHALIWRRGRLFIVLTVAYFGVSLLTQNMGYMTLPLGYVITLAFLLAGILIAKHSDESLSLEPQTVITLLQKTILRLIILALLATIVTVAAVVLGSWLLPVLPQSASPAGLQTPEMIGRLINWIVPGSIRFFIVALAVTISGMWFLLPLIVFHTLTLLESALLSKRAERINISVVLLIGYGPVFGVILLLLLHDIGYLVTAALLPYFSAVQFVAYRHIFMQRKQNSPARALSPSFKTLTA